MSDLSLQGVANAPSFHQSPLFTPARQDFDPATQGYGDPTVSITSDALRESSLQARSMILDGAPLEHPSFESTGDSIDWVARGIDAISRGWAWTRDNSGELPPGQAKHISDHLGDLSRYAKAFDIAGIGVDALQASQSEDPLREFFVLAGGYVGGRAVGSAGALAGGAVLSAPGAVGGYLAGSAVGEEIGEIVVGEGYDLIAGQLDRVDWNALTEDVQNNWDASADFVSQTWEGGSTWVFDTWDAGADLASGTWDSVSDYLPEFDW